MDERRLREAQKMHDDESPTDDTTPLPYPFFTAAEHDLLGVEFASYSPDVLQEQADEPCFFRVSWPIVSADRDAFERLSYSARRDVLMGLTRGELARYV